MAIKTATTIDGKTATSNGSSKWITSENARLEVQNIRKKYDAILTTSSTIIADNPHMLHKNKIILDRTLKTDFLNAEIYKTGNCHVFYDKNIASERLDSILSAIKNKNNISLLPINVTSNKIDLEAVLDKIYELGIMSVLVEAGGHLNGSILKYTDRIYQFIAPKVLGDNKGLSCFDYRDVNSINMTENFKIDKIKTFEPDILITYSK